MGATYVNKFNLHTLEQVWQWLDSENADTALVAFIEEYNLSTARDFSVDRSSARPTLTWQVYEWAKVGEYQYAYVPTGVWEELALPDGALVFRDPSGGAPTAHDMSGWWFCDEYGRPFDLNDLLADAGQ